MKRLPIELDQSAEIGARKIVLSHLSDAGDALRRLRHGEDTKALHDFRVALRRSRAAIETWREYLPKKTSAKRGRQLRKLQRATSGARDAEVALAWVTSVRGEDPGSAHLITDLEDEIRRFEDENDLRLRFERVRRKLSADLRKLEIDLLSEDLEITFREATAFGVEQRFAELAESLQRIESLDPEVVHSARTATKRLRYTIEPIANLVPLAASAEAHLAQLQDLLGELVDANLLAQRIDRAAEPDFAIVRARNLTRIGALQEKFRAEWKNGHLMALASDIEHLVQALRG